MKIENAIQNKIEFALKPVRLTIENESHKHSSGLGAESHFKVLVVTDMFRNLNRVQRQRRVFEILSEEMKQIHALSLRLLTVEEEATLSAFETPNCQSSKK